MKILFVMPTHISYGGIESVGINLWKGLTELGHEVDFVCHGSIVGAYEDYIKFCGTNVYHIPGKNENIIATICEFKRIITAKSYDVIHAHMNATSGIYLQIASTYHIPILVAHSHVSTMAMYTKNIMKALINLYEKNRTNRFSNVKIACSKKAGDWLFGTEPYSIVLNAIDNNKFVFSDEIRKAKREELQLCENNDVYIHIGGFLAYKNHRYLLRVFRNIKNMNNNARLILIGDGPLRKKIEEELRDLGIADSVLMLGERKDVCELLQAADVFLLPSISEGNPVSLVEAATSGLHCLVSDSVAKDTAPYFLKGSIEFLSISEENIGEWVKKGLKKYNRIIYCEDNPCKLSALSMAKEVEKLYLKISKRDIEGKGEMNSKKVSVIIPVYNTEKYLDKCISSVINQTYKNIEIIIVDDGSTDHSSALCKKWESIDERVLVLRKVNGGLSSARNYGLEKSSGNYIFFVDSDDWIASNTIELMVCKAEALNCDIVISNYYDYYSETQIVPVIRTKEQLVLEPVEKCLLNILPTNAWGKLIRRDIFYDDANLILRFPENRRYEDTVISFKQILKAQIVYTLSDALYYYRQNMESIVYNPKATDITDIIKNVTEIRNLLKNKVSEELLEAYLCSTLVFAYQLYYRTSCNNAELRKRLISSIKYSASKVRVRTACKNIKRKKILIAKLPFFDIIIQLNEKAKRKF